MLIETWLDWLTLELGPNNKLANRPLSTDGGSPCYIEPIPLTGSTAVNLERVLDACFQTATLASLMRSDAIERVNWGICGHGVSVARIQYYAQVMFRTTVQDSSGGED